MCARHCRLEREVGALPVMSFPPHQRACSPDAILTRAGTRPLRAHFGRDVLRPALVRAGLGDRRFDEGRARLENYTAGSRPTRGREPERRRSSGSPPAQDWSWLPTRTRRRLAPDERPAASGRDLAAYLEEALMMMNERRDPDPAVKVRADARKLEKYADEEGNYPAGTTVRRGPGPSRMVNIRLTDEQYQQLEQVARDRHLPLPTMARAWLLAHSGANGRPPERHLPFRRCCQEERHHFPEEPPRAETGTPPAGRCARGQLPPLLPVLQSAHPPEDHRSLTVHIQGNDCGTDATVVRRCATAHNGGSSTGSSCDVMKNGLAGDVRTPCDASGTPRARPWLLRRHASLPAVRAAQLRRAILVGGEK